MLLLVSPFLCRWREASGADAACASCDSVSIKPVASSVGIVGSGSASSSWGTGTGSSGSHHERKIRDASTKDSMSIKIVKYLIFYKEN